MEGEDGTVATGDASQRAGNGAQWRGARRPKGSGACPVLSWMTPDLFRSQYPETYEAWMFIESLELSIKLQACVVLMYSRFDRKCLLYNQFYKLPVDPTPSLDEAW